MTIEEQIADLEAKLAELNKLKEQEPDYEALRDAVHAYFNARRANYRCSVPMGCVDWEYARALLAAYPLLKAYHEAREKK